MISWNQALLLCGVKVDGPIKGVCVDTRLLAEQEVFIALHSGHEYIQDALLLGATCIISERDDPDPRVHLVKCTRTFLGHLAQVYRSSLSASVIGITGSVGKTSLTQILKQLLRSEGETVATSGNQNNELGVPLTILRAGQTTKYLTNLNTGVQYRWTGTEWILSFEGEYQKGTWRLVF